MNNTYNFTKHQSFKVSKRSKLYNLVVFCNTLGCSLIRHTDFTKDERDYLTYYGYYKNLDNEGIYYFNNLFTKLYSHYSLVGELANFFYNPKACNIDVYTLLYCAILLNNYGMDFTDFLEKWNSSYFIKGELLFK